MIVHKCLRMTSVFVPIKTQTSSKHCNLVSVVELFQLFPIHSSPGFPENCKNWGTFFFFGQFTCNMLPDWQNSCLGQCQASNHAVSDSTGQFSLRSVRKEEWTIYFSRRKKTINLCESDELPTTVLLRSLQLVHVAWSKTLLAQSLAVQM